MAQLINVGSPEGQQHANVSRGRWQAGLVSLHDSPECVIPPSFPEMVDFSWAWREADRRQSSEDHSNATTNVCFARVPSGHTELHGVERSRGRFSPELPRPVAAMQNAATVGERGR